MSQRNKYWTGVIEQYKMSGLSQPAFCKDNELSWNQFQYRWSLHNRAEKAKAESTMHRDINKTHAFESVSIFIPAPAPQTEDSDVVELMIHLPNQIRCSVKLALRSNGFNTLLKQLVALC